MKAIVLANDVEVKQEDITAEEFKAYMNELSHDDMIDALRKSAKLFKPKSYTFKGVK